MIFQSVEDEVVVHRVKEGDRDAFGLLVEKYRGPILRIILRRTRNDLDAEDLVQETFIRAYRAVDQFRGDASFYTWLYVITINVVKSYRRWPEIVPYLGASDTEYSDAECDLNVPVDFDNPESLLECKQMARAISATFEKLPLNFQTALSLREIDGLSYEEIAHGSGCPIGTVRSRIFRAREIIASTLHDFGCRA
jgi:RNA polymerase sigma-70 factor (ECF subfamily)